MTIDVLLLEDDPAKKNRLLTFLNSKCGDLFGRVDTVLSVADAIVHLKERQYDLLVADVVVPAVLGGALDESHSIDLFVQIDEGVKIKRPRHSVALSAYENLSNVAKEFFSGRPWGILRYDDTSNECIVTVEKICRYIMQKSTQNPEPHNCDVVVVTALMEPEFSALETAGIDWTPLEPLDEVQFVRYGQIAINGISRTIGAAFAPRMGPVASAVLVSKMIHRLRPRVVIMCGICAGIPGKAGIGDVIAPDISWDWQSGKYVDRDGEEHFEIGSHPICVNEQVRAQLVLLKRDSKFWDSLSSLAAKQKQGTPKMVLGPMATGSSVLADARVADRIKSTQHRGLCGLDMEVYGAYAAAVSCDPRIHVLALKAVCDQGDKQKNDQFQEYAATIAARTTAKFISDYLQTLFGDEGGR